MIVDSMANIRKYAGLLNHLEEGLAAIEALEDKKPGRYEFEGGFFMVQEGTTRPLSEGLLEAHRRYVDVQIMLEGSELAGWEDLGKCTEDAPFSEEKDIGFYHGDQSHYMKIDAGMFYIVFPWDAHEPISHVDEPTSYRKIVMKLPV